MVYSNLFPFLNYCSVILSSDIIFTTAYRTVGTKIGQMAACGTKDLDWLPKFCAQPIRMQDLPLI
jgi:hypothetical protein